MLALRRRDAAGASPGKNAKHEGDQIGEQHLESLQGRRVGGVIGRAARWAPLMVRSTATS
jgi:hypothetical protein